jgi:hypothetical protein
MLAPSGSVKLQMSDSITKPTNPCCINMQSTIKNQLPVLFHHHQHDMRQHHTCNVGLTCIIHCTMQCSTFVRIRMKIADEAALRAWLLLGTTRQGLMSSPLVPGALKSPTQVMWVMWVGAYIHFVSP